MTYRTKSLATELAIDLAHPPKMIGHRERCTTAKRHIDAICHNRRYMSQMAIQFVAIDAKYLSLTLNVTTLCVTKISFLFQNVTTKN